MINTTMWKEFKISEVFITITKKHSESLQVPTGATMSKKNLIDGDIPRVTVSNYNNGIIGYYTDSDDKNYRTYKNFISVSFLGTVFYHPEKVSLDMKVHCLKPIDYELNEYSASYIVSVVRKTIMNFEYANQLSSTILADLTLKLPSTSDGKPNWTYMEDYMKQIMEKSKKNIENLKKANDTKHLIDVSGWGKFRVSDFFEVMKGKNKLSNVDIDDGDTPVYSSNSVNGGIFGYTTKKPDYIINEKNPLYIVFGDHTKAINIAKKSFSIMDNVKVLSTKLRNQNVLRFIMTSWMLNVPNLGYARHWAKAKEAIIYLPITSTGEPDWQYMEDYMKQIMDESEQIVSDLQNKVRELYGKTKD